MIPETATSTPLTTIARVRSVGSPAIDKKGRQSIPEFGPGDMVVIGLVSTEIWVGDQLMLLCDHSNVIARVDPQRD